ncbi:MAG TPA: hypothetical protein VJZ71_16600 [Phycisphaerae bacterium]|nr:hypothetical protein [Phycisphaerae bacterium]
MLPQFPFQVALYCSIAAAGLTFFFLRRLKLPNLATIIAPAFLAGYILLSEIEYSRESERFFYQYDLSPRVWHEILLPILRALSSVANIAMVAFGVWLVWKIVAPTSRSVSELSRLDDDSVLRDAVKRIIHSDRFFTALGEALPRGADDAEYGLDYLPYIINKINDRRRRFAFATNWFLVLTLLVGAVSGVIVTYFGYLLVNDEAAGAPRILARIDDALGTVNVSLERIRPTVYAAATHSAASEALRDLQYPTPSVGNSQTKAEIKRAIEESQTTHDLKALSNAFSEAEKGFKIDNDDDRRYLTSLTAVRSAIDRAEVAESESEKALRPTAKALDGLVLEARRSLENPGSRIPELIKRFVIAIVVSSFFLAILRYIAGIYRNHFLETLRAERDDLEVRRFYLAYKGLAHGSAERASVIAAFMAQSPRPPGELSDESANDAKVAIEPGLAKTLIETLKDLAESLSKKA